MGGWHCCAIEIGTAYCDKAHRWHPKQAVCMKLLQHSQALILTADLLHIIQNISLGAGAAE
jgi:hypothetical protein